MTQSLPDAPVMERRRKSERGFSLLELMMAVSLLSLAVIPLLVNQGNAMRNAARLEERALAAMVAENIITEMTAHETLPKTRKGRQIMGGLRFSYRIKTEIDARTALTRLTVEVKKRGDRTVLARLTGYREGQP